MRWYEGGIEKPFGRTALLVKYVPLADQLEAQGFVPRSRRIANVIAQRVAAGVQPVKRALPMLLPEGLGPEAHLELVLQLAHLFQLKQLPSSLRLRAVEFV